MRFKVPTGQHLTKAIKLGRICKDCKFCPIGSSNCITCYNM